MAFEWDQAKNRANIAKHGVSFETASSIFDGPIVSWIDDRKDYGETRSFSIGQVEANFILTVIHTDRTGKKRIISARPASKNERSLYNERTLQKRAEH
jgi:uncharacterized protein